MSFKDLDIKTSYTSCGENGIAPAFIVPVLKQTRLYQRCSGFFSSGVFEPILKGIIPFARNKGKIQLITSPILSAEDIEAIKEGYKQKEETYKSSFSQEFLSAIDCLSDTNLELLVELIRTDVLDIKLAIPKDSIGIYHDKLGIIEDFDGNKMVFFGSANSSLGGYRNNYERIRVEKSWEGYDERIEDECKYFNSLWNGTDQYVSVYSCKESIQNSIFQVQKNRNKAKEKKSPIELRDYQKDAISAWVKNKYHGFYVMATGTGKTWTAIYSAKKLLESKAAMIVVLAPYKHLIKQWADDIIEAFPESKIIMVSSENPQWEVQLTDKIISKQYNTDVQIIVVCTIKSFNSNRFKDTINKSTEDKLLIVDEAHRFTARDEEIHNTYKYMLGLSATPFSGSSASKGKALMDFFGGNVFNLPIENAIGKYLVNYYYYPIFVNATVEEELKFKQYSKNIISCFRNGICIDQDKLIKCLMGRLRIISMASEKQSRIKEILAHVKEKDHFIVYCGDGRLFDSGEERRHISFVKKVLNDDFGYRPSQFTAKESMLERMKLVDEFNKGNITALSAIRCLDEGINIPSIKSALILSSNDDYREFVQRRGRILRKYNDNGTEKENAVIYDVIVLPKQEQNWAKIEFRRFFEYARLSLNWRELNPQLNNYLSQYGLTQDEVDVYDYEDMEDTLDE